MVTIPAKRPSLQDMTALRFATPSPREDLLSGILARPRPGDCACLYFHSHPHANPSGPISNCPGATGYLCWSRPFVADPGLGAIVPISPDQPPSLRSFEAQATMRALSDQQSLHRTSHLRSAGHSLSRSTAAQALSIHLTVNNTSAIGGSRPGWQASPRAIPSADPGISICPAGRHSSPRPGGLQARKALLGASVSLIRQVGSVRPSVPLPLLSPPLCWLLHPQWPSRIGAFGSPRCRAQQHSW
ncbi:hypothetical protein NDU88_003364 [Pleurodeles waltl]|uniref:Uncharacterized protein n=1 Tax=Pleurodeles waltl TaxID=8319 RepID=A0AAV7MQD5_PLEWA|nr:hypothetical protein NDU88_003364 [Pleurodeles waltl]